MATQEARTMACGQKTRAYTRRGNEEGDKVGRDETAFAERPQLSALATAMVTNG